MAPSIKGKKAKHLTQNKHLLEAEARQIKMGHKAVGFIMAGRDT